MHIVCPSCETRYAVKAESFPQAGRRVRCGDSWHALAEGGVAEPEAVQVAEPTVTDAAEAPEAVEQANAEAVEAPGPEMPIVEPVEPDLGWAPEVDEIAPQAQMAETYAQADGAESGDNELAAAKARRAARFSSGAQIRVRRRTTPLHAFSASVMLALAAAAFVYREDVVRTLPATAAIFAMAGHPVNLRGIDFEDVSHERRFELGVPVLIVQGRIVNIADDVRPIPAIRFTLRGGAAQSIYAWTIEPRQRVLEECAEMTFRSRLASPPHEAEEVLVRFTARQAQRLGMQ